ncbi:hypothetical protein EMO92_11115 [Bifidobacterium reuteri]|uniref:O-antigen ligase-related domain-containing protein n=1 Tax=Bifidobacterium reuteri TaxID=983706 RepID=A0A5J5DZX5_9BIFI|nr:O-antigen ligase family protein [Bifidobacterium reuteri]KAA8822411.1 hypothetical protein EMO92_11115 [Bifidobacterium reuteri]
MALAANQMSFNGGLEKVPSIRNLLWKLRVEDIIFVVCVATCVYPLGYYSYVPSLSAVYMNAKYAVIAIISVLLLLKKYKPSLIAILIVGFDAYLLLTTIAFDGNINRWAQFALYRIALICVFDYMLSRRPVFALGTITLICLAHLAINEVLGSAGTSSLNVDNAMYWLGIRVRIAGFALPAMAFSLLFCIYSKISKLIKLPILIAVYALAITFFIQKNVSTALVSSSLSLILLLLFVTYKKFAKRISLIAAIAAVALNFAIIFFDFQNKFSWLIEGILGKSLTLTGRVGIWHSVLSKMQGHYLFGHGVGSGIPFIYEFGEPITYEHNQLLNVLFSGGIVGLVFLFVILFVTFRSIASVEPSPYTSVVTAFLLAMCVQMISEHPYENALFALLLLFGYRYKDIPLPQPQRLFRSIRFKLF